MFFFCIIFYFLTFNRSHKPVRVHQKLTDDHIFLSTKMKMRNHLAQEALDDNMYNLMVKYRDSLNDGNVLTEASKSLTKHVKL